MRQSYPNTEIIVVVDSGSEELASVLRKDLPSNVFVILSTGHGLSEARNTGVARATGDIIAQIDDDAVAAETWIEKLVCNYQDSKVTAVGGRVDPIWPASKPKWVSERLYWIVGCSYTGTAQTRRAVRNVLGANMSYRKDIRILGLMRFRSALGMNAAERWSMACDETDFFINLSRLIPGAQIILDPDAIVRHYVSKGKLSLSYFLRRAFSEGLSKAIISRDYGFASLTEERNYVRGTFRELLCHDRRKATGFSNLIFELPRALVLAAVICATVLGFVIGHLRGYD